MVRDAVLRCGHCQGGNGQPQQCKSLLLHKGEGFSEWYQFVIFLCLTIDPFFFSEKIHARVWGYKRPNLFHANRHARLWHKQEGSYCCQWGKYTPTHTHKQMYHCTFIGPISCGRHDRELTHVSEQSVSQRTESTLTQGHTLLCPHMHCMTERSTFGSLSLHKSSV